MNAAAEQKPADLSHPCRGWGKEFGRDLRCSEERRGEERRGSGRQISTDHQPVGESAGRQRSRHSHPPSMDRDSHSEDTLSTMVLENIKNKLIHAFRAAGESREDPQEAGCTVRPVSMGRSYQANEELRRAKIDGALTWLRSELVRHV